MAKGLRAPEQGLEQGLERKGRVAVLELGERAPLAGPVCSRWQALKVLAELVLGGWGLEREERALLAGLVCSRWQALKVLAELVLGGWVCRALWTEGLPVQPVWVKQGRGQEAPLVEVVRAQRVRLTPAWVERGRLEAL
jgi:hypothetical protein